MSDDVLRLRIIDVLNLNGLASEGGIHSWRCFEPDRFPNFCRCVEGLADEIVAAVAASGVNQGSE